MDFDDSFFDENANDKKGKNKGLCEEYNPKVCEPKVTALFLYRKTPYSLVIRSMYEIVVCSTRETKLQQQAGL